MKIEFQQAITRLREEATKLRRQHKKTGDGRFKVRANALEQLAARIRLAVPTDPDDDDLGRICTEMLGPEVLRAAGLQMPAKQFVTKARRSAVRGRTRYYVHLDDFQFFDRDGAPRAIREALHAAGEA